MGIPDSKHHQAPTVEFKQHVCKACGLCIAYCPRKVLQAATSVNDLGFHPTEYVGEGCTGCGTCYDVCPEIGVIRVHRPRKREDPTTSSPNAGSTDDLGEVAN